MRSSNCELLDIRPLRPNVASEATQSQYNDHRVCQVGVDLIFIGFNRKERLHEPANDGVGNLKRCANQSTGKSSHHNTGASAKQLIYESDDTCWLLFCFLLGYRDTGRDVILGRIDTMMWVIHKVEPATRSVQFSAKLMVNSPRHGMEEQLGVLRVAEGYVLNPWCLAGHAVQGQATLRTLCHLLHIQFLLALVLIPAPEAG